MVQEIGSLVGEEAREGQSGLIGEDVAKTVELAGDECGRRLGMRCLR
jgi:hypothetical protein